MSLLGIDIGTSGCKAATFSEDGHCLASSYREYPTIYAGAGRAELDSKLVWQSVQEVITKVAAETKKDAVTALCVGTMGEAATPVSKEGEILGNCFLSSDSRGGEYIETLKEKYDQNAFYQINPNILTPGYTLPKLMWLKEQKPELYEHADKFLLWDGLVGFMLGCDPFTSYSLANRTLLFDIRKENWSDELLEATGIELEKLPRCLLEGTVAGTIQARAANQLGLPNGVKVVVGGHDQCCNALGAGIAQPGRAVYGIGTFDCITPVYGYLPDGNVMLRAGLNIEHHVLPGLYVSFLYNQGGSLVRWFRDTFARETQEIDSIYECLMAEMPENPTQLFVLPYFEITGPPEFVGEASGVIAGLKMNTTRGEILKAIIESATLYFVDSIQRMKDMGIDTSEFVATGGGAASDAGLQIKSDIIGVPFVRPRITECGLLGTAILAGISTGVFNTAEEGIDCFVQREHVYEPDPHRHAIYRERLLMYRELFPLMRDYLAKMENMM